MKKYWFKRKKYGYGWVPNTWQGWLVTVLFVVFMLLIGLSLTPETTALEALSALAVPILLLVSICYMTGEKPRWQWGESDEGSDYSTGKK